MLRKDRPGACFLCRSHQVVLRFVAFQRSGQKLVHLHRAVGISMRNADLKHTPVSDIEECNRTHQYGKKSDDLPDPAPNHISFPAHT